MPLFLALCGLFAAGAACWGAATIRGAPLWQQLGRVILIASAVGIVAMSTLRSYDFGIFLGLATLSAAAVWAAGAHTRTRECARTSGGYFVFLAIIFVVRSFVIEPMRIPSSSMEPGLRDGDFILVDKGSYGFRLPGMQTPVVQPSLPERGDLVVFRHQGILLIKRVIGLPGETVSMVGDALFINKERVRSEPLVRPETDAQSAPRRVRETIGDLSYLTQQMPGRRSRSFITRVPKGHLFVMGDNRHNSRDSRSYGTVPAEALVGQARWVWLRWPSLVRLPTFFGLADIN